MAVETNKASNGAVVTASNDDFVTITSMSQAAYFVIRGLKLVSGRRTDRRNEFSFTFEDPNRQAEQLSMDFLSSECRAFDHAVRDLRALTSARRT